MRDDKQIFVDWLKYAIKIEGKMTGEALSKKAKIHAGTISGYLTNKSKGPREIKDRVKICEALGADYQEIIEAGRQKDLSGSSPIISEREKIITDIDPVTVEHRELVKYFSSKKMALEANRKLVDLDVKDPIRFAELVTIITKFANGVDFVEVREQERLENSPPIGGKRSTA